MPRKKSQPEEDGAIDPVLIEATRPYAGMKMRIPADARMSENIEDTRGEAAIYNNRLAMQKTRGARSQANREFFTPRKAVTQMDQDIDETAEKFRRNAGGLGPNMLASEEREVLDTGSSPAYDAWRKKQDLDDLMERLSREQRSTGKDTRGFEDLIEKEAGGFAKGGMVTKSKSKSAGSKHRGDGCCMKGHTKGKVY